MKAKNNIKKNRNDLKPKVQANDPIVESRVQDCISMMTNGFTTAMIYKFAKEKGWDVTTRQVDNYIAKAKEYFVEISKFKKEENFGLIISRYGDLYYKSMTKKDLKTCTIINDKLSKTLGFTENQSNQILINNVNKIDFNGLTDEQLRNISAGNFKDIFSGASVEGESIAEIEGTGTTE